MCENCVNLQPCVYCQAREESIDLGLGIGSSYTHTNECLLESRLSSLVNKRFSQAIFGMSFNCRSIFVFSTSLLCLITAIKVAFIRLSKCCETTKPGLCKNFQGLGEVLNKTYIFFGVSWISSPNFALFLGKIYQ